MTSPTSPICLHPDNPRYFLYRGRPRVLITATEHYGAVLNRNFDYVRYLDGAANGKATLSRCFLLFRELEGAMNPHSPCKPTPGEYVSPFPRSGPGYATDGFPRFDLDRWDQEYFQRLHGYLTEAAARDVVIELTLFSNTYSDKVWELNPFNVKNNINGVGDIAWQDYTSMADRALFERQLAYVRKIVNEVNAYDNIYFEICNEPFGDLPGHASVAEVRAWHDAIRAAIRNDEASLPKQHLIFQVPIERSRFGSELDPLVDNETIDAINLHDYHHLFCRNMAFHPLSRFMQRDLKLRSVQHLWTACYEVKKPLVFDEDNAATSSRDEQSWIVHRKRAWTTVCSGGHYNMIDFSIQAGGQESGSPEAQSKIRSWMKYLSTFIHNVDFIHAVPRTDFCSELPTGTISSTLANPGREYVIYLADAREIGETGHDDRCSGDLAFSLPSGRYHVRFYSPARGEYLSHGYSIDGGNVSLPAYAFSHDIVAHITTLE